MSESQEDAEKKKSAEKKTDQTESKQETAAQPATKPTAPRVGTPVGQATTRPRIGTPIGSEPASTAPTPAPRPAVGTPRPSVGTPIGTPRPTVGTPVGAKPAASASASANAKPAVPSAPPAPRPAVSTPAKTAVPTKPPESRAEISRRNFIKGLAVLGGIIAVGQFVALGPYLQGSVGQSNISSQVIQDTSGVTLRTNNPSISKPNDWTTFVYPRTGNPNIDNDTFRQCVIIHLPKGWTAGSYGAVDPISGDTFVALSRVCVHLWCLWSYVSSSNKGICPCHGSQYIPGGPSGSQDANDPGLAVAGPASLQTAPNNQLPIITLKIASDGTISATGVIGQIGCGKNC